MATASVDLLKKLEEQNLLNQLIAIIRSDISDFDKLSDQEKKILFTAALAVGYKTNLQLFLDLKTHPEKIGLPPLPADELATAAVNAQVIAANLELYLADKEALEKQINTVFPDRTQKDRDLIKRLVLLAVIKKQAELFSLKTDPQTKKTLAFINQQTDPKNPPLPVIEENLRQLITTSVTQTNIAFTPPEINQAVEFLTTATLADLVDYTTPASTATAIQIALSISPQYHTPTAEIFRQIENSITLTPTPDYTSTVTTQVTPQIAIVLREIALPPAEVKPEEVKFSISTPLQDKIEETQVLARDLSTKILINPQTDEVMARLAGTITPKQHAEFIQVIVADNLVTRSFPTKQGAATAQVVNQLNPTNPYLSPTVIEAVSMGLVMRAVEEHIATKPESKTAEFLKENPHVLPHLRIGFQRLENPNNNLGQEISAHISQTFVARQPSQTAIPIPTPPVVIPQPTPPRPIAKTSIFTQFSANYQSVTNKISGLLPDRVAQVFNVVTHPVQFVQSRVGNIIGDRIVGQFRNWLSEKVVSRIANETVKKAAQFVLKEGLQQGIKLLGKEGLKRGLQALAVGLGAPTGGVSLVAAAALEAVFFIGGKVVSAVSSGINSVFRVFTGEDFDWKPVAAAPLLLLTSTGGLLGSLAAATSIAAASAGVVLIGSSIFGGILYVTIIAVAPIISSIAHLEAAISAPYQLVSGGVIPEGCPSGWPTATGHIVQGAHGRYSHRIVEAIDVSVGLATPIIATHNGLATYTAGNNIYGNYVDVTSTCNSITFTTRYGHMLYGAFSGQKIVAKGEVIGYVDNTGASSGNHVHYEIRGGNLGSINQFLPKFVPEACSNYTDDSGYHDECHTSVP